jgi:ATP-dependent DNA helicase PIF1
MTTSPSQSPWPFKLSRRQFSITISYAMTIKKSQGQSLDFVGLYLPRPVFGKLYVAISRVKSKAGLEILICDDASEANDTTTNVVFKEIFNNV